MFNLNIDDGTFAAMHIAEIIALVMVSGTIGILFKILPKMIENKIAMQKSLNGQFEEESKSILDDVKSTIDRFENEYNLDRKERATRHIEVDKRFDSINDKISNLYSTITETGELLDKVSEGTLLNMLFNENLDDYNRLKAFVRLTAMNVNNDVKTKGVELALHNKEVWKIVLDDIRKKKIILIIVNQKYYDETMSEINRTIWR